MVVVVVVTMVIGAVVVVVVVASCVVVAVTVGMTGSENVGVGVVLVVGSSALDSGNIAIAATVSGSSSGLSGLIALTIPPASKTTITQNHQRL